MDRRVAISADSFPHLIDMILEELIVIDPFTMRLVCKAWRDKLARAYSDWVTADLTVPGIRIMPGSGWGGEPDYLEPYCWQFVAGRLPSVVYEKVSLDWTNQPREVHTAMPLENVRVLDMAQCVEWVRHPIPLVADTVRFRQEKYRSIAFDAVQLVPHVRRVIFSDGSYGRERARASPDEALDADPLRCTNRDCGQQHIERVVVNCRTPVPHTNGNDTVGLPGLPELVVILHGWGVVTNWDPVTPATYHAGDPLNDVRGVALAALKLGSRVTIVNPEMRDSRTGIAKTNVVNVRNILLHFFNVDTERDPEHNLEDLVTRLEWLTTEEYKERVGEEQFRIETMIDVCS